MRSSPVLGLVVPAAVAEHEGMEIALVLVAGCPHAEAARGLLREALDDIGLGSESFEVVVVEDQVQAAELNFLGSPSFYVGGRDVLGRPGCPAGLACRVYGQGQPLPGLRDLRRGLKEAAAGVVRG
jgi:hypothetical protein